MKKITKDEYGVIIRFEEFDEKGNKILHKEPTYWAKWEYDDKERLILYMNSKGVYEKYEYED